MKTLLKIHITQFTPVRLLGWLFCLLASGSFLLADSGIAPKLENLPTANQVIAFSNWIDRRINPAYTPNLVSPSHTLPITQQLTERYLLSENCLKNFLQSGHVEKFNASETKHGKSQLNNLPLPMGVFFTSEQQVFFWEMKNEHFLHIWDRDGRLAILSMADACLPITIKTTEKILPPPKRGEIVSFIATNNLYRSRSSYQDLFNENLREEIRRSNQNRPLPSPIPQKIEEKLLFEFLDHGKPQASVYRMLPFGSPIRPNGGLVLRDRRILYCELFDPKLLFIEAEDGASCALKL